uniref:Uncharacterized protein n=1 Tax=Candidatus Kentrum eta TaxID=2126337 RepID=A0A450UGW3_9GAMM|nr:MAG: hypothetical protein BECKH772A_GA0070896_1003417 [Candidatus Kentron sp. H]VFJ92971.1 MAG: hypothetical protein BECKH772B_GA0070898_1003617 [Candidatus Kentron sp. H]VFJ99581.1 MAG: hypothetical protein BECKH772C_GA0070978_1003317 [Candidatus Kentron sp. H]
MAKAGRKMRSKRLPEIPENWQSFLLSLLFHMLLPLLPLLIESWIRGTLGNHAITIVAAIYAMSISVSSKSRIFFGLYIFIGFMFSFAYGVTLVNEHALSNLAQYAFISITFVFLTHAGERWNAHVIDGEPYWNF